MLSNPASIKFHFLIKYNLQAIPHTFNFSSKSNPHSFTVQMHHIDFNHATNTKTFQFVIRICKDFFIQNALCTLSSTFIIIMRFRKKKKKSEISAHSNFYLSGRQPQGCFHSPTYWILLITVTLEHNYDVLTLHILLVNLVHFF